MGREKKYFGSFNPDKTFYVIRPRHKTIEGLGSLMIWGLRHIDYALSQGYIPYMDFSNFIRGNEKCKQNIWELYFSQPQNIDRTEIFRSKNVILSGYRKDDIITPHFPDRIFKKEDNALLYQTIIQNLHLKDYIEKKISIEGDHLQIEQCCGVFLRGTDFVALNPSGHHIQVCVDELLDELDKFLKGHKGCPIFLVTEDGRIYRQMKQKYPDCRIASFDSFIEDYSGTKYLVYEKNNQGNTDEEYFIKMLLLSRCRYFVGTSASGSDFARIMNGGRYEEELVLDHGNYS